MTYTFSSTLLLFQQICCNTQLSALHPLVLLNLVLLCESNGNTVLGGSLCFISPLTDMDHNSPHVSSMYITHSTALHVQQPLSSYILCLSVRYSLNCEFKPNYIFNCGLIQTHYNCNCVLVLTSLKMATWVAKMCWWLPYNWFDLVYLLILLVTFVTMDTSITVYNLCLATQLKI